MTEEARRRHLVFLMKLPVGQLVPMGGRAGVKLGADRCQSGLLKALSTD